MSNRIDFIDQKLRNNGIRFYYEPNTEWNVNLLTILFTKGLLIDVLVINICKSHHIENSEIRFEQDWIKLKSNGKRN